MELVRTIRPEAYEDAFMRGLSFHQLSLGAGHRNGPKAMHDMLAAGQAFTQLLIDGAVIIPKLQTIDLDDVPEALVAMRNQRTVGKIVLTIGH